MISVFEPVCTQSEHASFNAALLIAASELALDGKTSFFGDITHIDRVAECLPDSFAPGVQFHAVNVAERHLRAFLPRFLVELPLLSHVWKATKDARSEALIITGVTEPGLLAIKLLFLLYRPRIPVLLVFHSVLPQFLYSAKRRFLLSALTPKRITYVVLGKHILHELNHLSPSIGRRFHSITHPYIFSPSQAPSKASLTIPKFAFVGLASPSKGFPEFLRLIENFHDSTQPATGAPFHFIGGISKDCIQIFENFKSTDVALRLHYPTTKDKLPLTEYQQKIAETDYLIMPHNKDAYKLVFSGSSLDSLLLLKPVIALRSSFFEAFFEQLGDIGYLCEDLAEMSALISDIIQNPPQKRYHQQVENLKNGRSFFEPKIVAAEIKYLIS